MRDMIGYFYATDLNFSHRSVQLVVVVKCYTRDDFQQYSKQLTFFLLINFDCCGTGM